MPLISVVRPWGLWSPPLKSFRKEGPNRRLPNIGSPRALGPPRCFSYPSSWIPLGGPHKPSQHGDLVAAVWLPHGQVRGNLKSLLKTRAVLGSTWSHGARQHATHLPFGLLLEALCHSLTVLLGPALLTTRQTQRLQVPA